MPTGRIATPMQLEDTLFAMLWTARARVDDFVDLVRLSDFSEEATRALWADFQRYGGAGFINEAAMLHDGSLTDERREYLTACTERMITDDPRDLRRRWVESRRDWRARQLIKRASSAVERAGSDAAALLAQLCADADAVVRDDERVTDDLGRQCDAAIAALRDEAPGLTYPWPTWDAKFGRIRRGELYSVVGETGRGKTTLIASLVAHWVHRLGERVAVFTTETEGHRYLTLLAGIQGGLRMEDEEPEAFAGVINGLWRPLAADGRLIINDYARPSAALVLTQLRRYRARGIRTFVLDHGHQVDLGRGLESWEALEQFAGDLHAFAQNEQATVWAAWQPRKAPSMGERNGGPLSIDAIKGGQGIAALSSRIFNPFTRPIAQTPAESELEDRMACAGELCEFLVACLKDRDHGPHRAVSRLYLDARTKRLTERSGAPFVANDPGVRP